VPVTRRMNPEKTSCLRWVGLSPPGNLVPSITNPRVLHLTRPSARSLRAKRYDLIVRRASG